MKISILTYSKGDNYGAVLQSYGLAEFLRRQGFDVEFIHYTWTNFTYSITSRITPLGRRFEKFRHKYLKHFSNICKNNDDLINAVATSSLCIVGSDQVWNPAISGYRALHYFFDFIPEHMPRISYAASFGTEHWVHEQLTENVKILLSKFDAISVREDSGINICKEIFGVDTIQVLDPTLLLGDFRSMLKIPKYKDHIVGFMFNPSSTYYAVLGALQESSKTKVLVMDLPRKTASISALRFKVSPFTAVEEWVTNIAYADLVVTDSFHCMVFSILFHREFVFVASDKKIVTRITSLLHKIGITERVFWSIESLREHIAQNGKLLCTSIDYDSVEKNLQRLRSLSASFLLDAIADCQNKYNLK